jgi:hypothetical protein
MDRKELEKVIRNLGYHYEAMISNSIIDKVPAEHIYTDEDTIEVVLENGIELVYWKETMRFEMIVITGKSLSKDLISLLPEPLCHIGNRTTTLASLGQPIIEKTPLELVNSDLYAWDFYQLRESLHPEASLEIQYGEQMEVSTIMISLLDKQS